MESYFPAKRYCSDADSRLVGNTTFQHGIGSAQCRFNASSSRTVPRTQRRSDTTSIRLNVVQMQLRFGVSSDHK